MVLSRGFISRNIVTRNGEFFPINPSKRYNLSFNPITSRKVEQDGFHPKGLWYALGDEWHEDNCSPYTAKYRYINELDVSKLNILKVNRYNFENITRKYSRSSSKNISWDLVSKNYDGVEISDEDLITGYYSRWSDFFGYKSGCIWKNQDKIKIVESKVI